MWLFDNIFNEHCNRMTQMCRIIKNSGWKTDNNHLSEQDIRNLLKALEKKPLFNSELHQLYRKQLAYFLYILISSLEENFEELPDVTISQLVLSLYWVSNKVMFWQAQTTDSNYKKVTKIVSKLFWNYDEYDISNINIWILWWLIMSYDSLNPGLWLHYANNFE